MRILQVSRSTKPKQFHSSCFVLLRASVRSSWTIVSRQRLNVARYQGWNSTSQKTGQDSQNAAARSSSWLSVLRDFASFDNDIAGGLDTDFAAALHGDVLALD